MQRFLLEDLANDLLDHLCETTSPKDTLRLLRSMGYSPENCEDLQFDRKDIEDVWEEN